MPCLRCHGLMRQERLGRFRRDGQLILWACINCGERIDKLILLNRRLHAELLRPSRQWAEAELFGKVG